MKNIEHLCRICVRESHFYKHIFSQGVTDDSVCKIINELCDLCIKESDGLPEYICSECFGKLVELQKFKKMVHDGSTALLSLKTKYSKVKNEDEIYTKNPLKKEKSGSSRSPKKTRKHHVIASGEGRTSAANLEKQIAMNEVFIKSEPVDEDAGEALPTMAGGDGEVIIPEARKAKSPTGGASKAQGTTAPKTLNGQQKSTGTATGHGSLQSGQRKHPVDGIGTLKVRTPQFLMKSGPVSSLQSQSGNNPPPLAIKQKALLLTDPRRQGNVFLQPMGPNNYMPLMLPNQQLILLQSPGSPGILQAAYLKPNVFPANLQPPNVANLRAGNVANAQPPAILTLQPQNMPNMPKLVLQRVDPPVSGAKVLATPPQSTLDSEKAASVSEEKIVEEEEEVEDEEEGGRREEEGMPEGEGGEEVEGGVEEEVEGDLPEALVDTDMGVSFLCKTVSSEHRPYVCETCGKCFRRRLHLRYHRSTHQDERPFACAECGKSFKLKTILTTHMMTHSREPPRFPCNLCEKRFPTKARLRYHQVVHSSERKFECNTCQKRYKTKNQLTVHLKTHLLRPPMFPCPSCDMRFKQRMGLRKHRERLNH